jgi:hypothetical protein
MGKLRSWRRFVDAVHDLLVSEGPLTAEAIPGRMDLGWIGASERHLRITPGRLRQELCGRTEEGRPFQELPDVRFAAVEGDLPWDGDSAMPGATRGGRDPPSFGGGIPVQFRLGQSLGGPATNT